MRSTKEYDHERYLKNRDKVLERRRIYRLKNRDKILEKNRAKAKMKALNKSPLKHPRTRKGNEVLKERIKCSLCNKRYAARFFKTIPYCRNCFSNKEVKDGK